MVRDELEKDLLENIRKKTTAKILEEQDLEGQITIAFERLKPYIKKLTQGLYANMEDELSREPTESWRDPVQEIADALTDIDS